MRIMNRHIRHTILLTLAIVVMAACGGGGSDVPSPAPTPTPTPTPTNPTNPDPEPTPIPTPQPAEPQPVAIGFRADLSDAVATTRSVGDGVLTTPLLETKGFGVYCWYTGSADFTTPKATRPPGATYTMLMRNQKVYKSGQWTYSPSKYWPLDSEEKLTFRAYAPYTDYMMEDSNGMPMIPVALGTEKPDDEDVLYGTDYENGTQHDPLWGTGRLVNPSTQEYYYPVKDPDDPVVSRSKLYGTHYDNITYEMSGYYRSKTTSPVFDTPNDTHNGTIDWYFHHGMAMLVFKARMEDNSGDDKAYITNIKVTPLYNQGLLSISSPATDNSDSSKPIWDVSDAGDMVVNINKFYDGESYISTFEIARNEKDPLDNTRPYYRTVTNPGLLIIPRVYNSTTPLTISVTYKRSPGDANGFTVTKTIDSQKFWGNTIYTLNITVGSALVVDIESVNVATVLTTSWSEITGNDHEVYNW